MNICTIIAKNYVAHARVLAESFRAVDPEGTCSVLVIDDFEDYLDPAAEPFELIGIGEIGLPDPERMAASYDVVEFSTAVKPWLLRHLLERPGSEAVTYLDPDIWIASSLAEVDRQAKEHGIVLNPHFTSPLPRDGLKPSDEDILIAGAYNLGFIALGTGEAASSLLEWWSERLEHHCVIDPEGGYFVDQRWIDLVPGLWPDLQILRDPGFNVAYWNLPTRSFERDGDGYSVDGMPLRFFHFSGFDPRKPGELSRHQNRIDLSASPALSQVCSEYAAALLDHGYTESKAWPYGWDLLPNGVRLDRPARHLHRQAVEEKAISSSIFTRRGAKRFTKYATEVPGPGANGGATRYAHAVRDSRTDLQQAFPDIEGRDAANFTRWMREQTDLGVSEQLLPPTVTVANGGGDGSRSAEPVASQGVNLAGYLSSELGVGEAARQILSALAACEIPAATIDVPVDSAQMPAALGGLGKSDLPHGFNLICVNADMLPELAGAASPEMFEGRHSAGLWFWEVGEFPERWSGSFEHVDEVWVASEHVAEAIRPRASVPVKTVRIPVTPEGPAELSRAELGMPEGFCFLFVFDFRSVFKRKNPLGIIEAFRQAFEPGSGVSLVIKSVSGDAFPAEAEALAEAAATHPDIHLIGETVDAAVKNAMIQSCDCYVSLHRCEGLGLTMAEAMYFERPVIATAYSGNLDFMTEENSYLVGHTMTKIGSGADPYPAEAEWAEPDIEQAASLMARIFAEPDAAAEVGRLAAADIRRTHSPRAAGERLEAHIGEARRRRVLARFDAPPAPAPGDPGGDAPGTELAPLAPGTIVPDGDPSTGRAQLHHLLRFGDPPPRRGAGRFRAFVKRLYMRVLRPYASHQHRVNASTAAAIDELSTMLRQAELRSGKAGEEMRTRLDSEIAAAEAAVSSRLAALKAQLTGVNTQLSGVDAQLSGVNAQLTTVKANTRKALELPRVVEKRTAALRKSLEEADAGLADALGRLDSFESSAEARERERERREAQTRRATTAIDTRLTTVDAEHTATRKWLASLADDINATFDRDRAAVDDLRSSQAEGSAQTDAALAALHEQAEDIRAALRASNAKPYMAEERFVARTHPLLGSVLGFTSPGGPAHEGYRDFEDLFRGPEKMIRDRQEVYLDLVAGFAPVFDAGCGRGEFLDLLKEKGVERRGVDIDPTMVARCREKGHDEVEEGDLLECLEGLEEDSVGTVFSAQVIEHLDLARLQRLLELSLARLRPGGLFIAETVNPHSPAALKSFWVDPSHRQPLFPETMLALCQLAGFSAADVFCPLGSGEWETDRLSEGEYAIVAIAPERGA
jgi:glycosyltransferase involved in cell wall biosynthesis/SAM-dependent methyltransferase